MAEKETKVDSLEQALLNAEIDLSVDNIQKLYDDENKLLAASTAWGSTDGGIRAVIEHRAAQLRHKILFTCTPVELPALRERLVELSQVISVFKKASLEAAKRAEQKEKEAEQEAEDEA